MKLDASLAIALLLSVHWCRQAKALPAQSMGDFAQLRSHADTYVVQVAGAAAGTVVYDLLVTPGSVISTVVQFTRKSMQQHVVTTLDPLSLRPREVRDSEPGELTNLVFREGRIRGTRITWDSTGRVDTTALNLPSDPATIERRTLMTFIPCLPLEPGRDFTTSVFDSRTLETALVHIAVRNVHRISLSSRTLDAFQVVLDGDLLVLPETVYVSTETPRRVLRTERPKRLLRVELP